MGRLRLFFPFLFFLFRNKTEFGSSLLLSLLIILSIGCATKYSPLPEKPLSDQEIRIITTNMEEQAKRVSSFYSLGTLLIKNWYSESEVNILIVGVKNPFKIKIEVTHPWGQPILHIKMDKTELQVLSFRDNRLYIGPFTTEALAKFIPAELNRDFIWAVLRGYPNLLNYQRIASLKANQLSLFNGRKNEVEIIHIFPESLLPRNVYYPNHLINMVFSDFKEDNGIYYAQEVRVENKKGKRDLIIKRKKTVFNKEIPEQIFVIKKPPAFKILYLKDMSY